MRLLGISAAFALLLGGIAEARHAPPAGPPAKELAMPKLEKDGRILQACRGCGCRGGAGYRLANGKCAPRER
jgi:hypothetical protein